MQPTGLNEQSPGADTLVGMRTRTITILSVVAVVLAACGGVAGDTTTSEDGSTTTVTEATTTTTEVAEAPGSVRLVYKLEPGTSFTYEVVIDQHIEMEAIGDASALGEGEDVPGEASIDLVGTTTFTHSIAEGPQPGTFEVTITGDFADLQISGVVDGELVDPTDLPDFADIEPVDVTLILDEQGNVIPDEGSFGDLGGDLGALGGLGDMSAPGMDLGRWLGPPFTDGEVGVGDSWSETIESPMMLGEDPIVTQIDSVVSGTDTIDGATVFVIDTTSTTSAIEFDLADLLLGFFGAFITDDASEEDVAEFEAMAEVLKFLFSIDETVTEMTTWFDYEAGYARRVDLSMATSMVIDINMPDEESGEMVAFGMDMAFVQEISYRLIDATSA